MDLFLIKKMIGALLMPVNITILLLIIAMLTARTRPSLSFKALTTGLGILLLSSLPPVSDALMAPIESKFKAFSRSDEPVDYIVILGCYHYSDSALPPTLELKTCSLQRLIEAIRISDIHPEAKIITSGGMSGGNSETHAEKVKQAAISMGIPEEKILTENSPRDTEEEAMMIAPGIIGSNVVLVTNSDHMQRAINYFNQHKVYPIAAPASFWLKGDGKTDGFDWKYYLPNSHALEQTTVAWYEILGLIWQWIRS